MRVLLAILTLATATMAAPTEMYFGFSTNAVSVATSPGYKFCTAATSVLTPTYPNNTVWCLGPANFSYKQTIIYDRLANVRLVLPTDPIAGMDTNATRTTLSQALLTSGFFVYETDVTFIGNWTSSVVLGAVLTSVTAAVFIISMLVQYFS